MAKITDITGLIDKGMWNYEPPFPTIDIRPLPPVPWVDGPVYCEIFDGMHSQTGTYLETPAHSYGNDNCYLLIDVPAEKLVDVPCVVLNLGEWEISEPGKRRGITVEDLEQCPAAKEIREGDAILIGTGHGKYWFHKDYLEGGPYFTKGAMDWIISKKPFILGSDSARWESFQEPQDIFAEFYAANILMLGPLVNLERVKSGRMKLTALPLKVPKTSCAPTRAVLIED